MQCSCFAVYALMHLNCSTGAVDPTKTKFERQSSIVICCPSLTCTLMIQPRDSFQNLCLTPGLVENTNYVDLDLYHSVVKQVSSDDIFTCSQVL